MKLLTLNCHAWQEENQLEKIKHLARVIYENQYDVITLQEASQLGESELVGGNIKSDNYILLLLNELKQLGEESYSFVWDFAHLGYDIYEEGLGIITKHPIIEEESFFVSKSNDRTFWKTRKLIKVTIDYNGKKIDVYSCHLGWWQDDIEPVDYQVDSLLEKVNNDRLTFIMGDFNNSATVRNEGYDYLINKGLFDTYNLAIEKDDGITVQGEIAGWDKNKEDLRLDIIFTNREVEVKTSRVIFNGVNKEVISDHLGVEVELTI